MFNMLLVVIIALALEYTPADVKKSDKSFSTVFFSTVTNDGGFFAVI
jgi:hypothetical protein